MGSTLTDIESGSAFDKYYFTRVQLLSFGLSFPITPDRRTRLAYNMHYDFEAGFIRTHRIGIMHYFHCWQFSLEFSKNTNYNGSGKEDDYSIHFNVKLNGVRNPLQEVKGEMSGIYRMKSSQRSSGGF